MPLRKKILFSVIAIVGLAIIAIAVFRATNDTLPPDVIQQESRDGQHMVVLYDYGYEPRSLVIKKGETVVFATAREGHHWPASNLHPTHDIYPTFDPQEPIAPDETWAFTFEEVGRWTFHDHLAPFYTGVIEVTE